MLATPIRSANARLAALRERYGDRLIGLVFALIAEALLVLVVISMALVGQPKPKEELRITSMDVRPKAEEPKAAAKPKIAEKSIQRPRPRPQPKEREVEPVKLPDAPPVKAIVPISKNQMAAMDIANLPRQPSPAQPKAMMGPINSGVPGDSKRVGSAPNGQPMYAAAWYREPTDDELRGYLSTAQGPGWALITCRTAPGWRVEDCVGLSEWPERSNLLRAVLAAAWQFQVRPPRVGGVSKVGEWVRIRIEYIDR